MTLPRGEYPAKGFASLDDPGRRRPTDQLTAADFQGTRWSEYHERQRATSDQDASSHRALGPEGQPDRRGGSGAGQGDASTDHSDAYTSPISPEPQASQDSWDMIDSGSRPADLYGSPSSGSSPDAYGSDRHAGSYSGSGYSGGSVTGDGYPGESNSGDLHRGDSYPGESYSDAGYSGESYFAQGYALARETQAHDALPYAGYAPTGGAEAYVAPETRAHEVPASAYPGGSTDYSTAYPNDSWSDYSTPSADESSGPYPEYPGQYASDYPAEQPTTRSSVDPETRAHEPLPYAGYSSAGYSPAGYSPADGAEAYLAPETRAHEVPATPYEGSSTDDVFEPAAGYATGHQTDYGNEYPVEYSPQGYAPTPETRAHPAVPYPGYLSESASEAYALAPETRAHEAVPYPGYLSESASEAYALAPETRAHEAVPYPGSSGTASEAYALAPETRAHEAVPYPDYGGGSATEAYVPTLAPGDADPYAFPFDEQGYPYPAGSGQPVAGVGADEDDDIPPGAPPGSRRRRGGRGHGGRRSPSWRRRGVIAGLTVLMLLVSLGVAAYLKLGGDFSRLGLSGLFGDGGSPAGAASLSAMNILVLGSDSRTGIDPSGGSTAVAVDSGNADTSLLVHLSADRKSVTVVSIPRDSMVPAPRDCKDPSSTVADGVVRQWNANFNRGGPACSIRAFEGNTSINVDHFVVVDFTGFEKVVDTLGGVDVCTPAAVRDKDGLLDLAAGRNHLTGDQALGYVRVRTSLGDGSDLGRIKRQQAFLSAIAQEATRSSLLKRPDKLYRFLLTATSSVTVDSGLNIGALKDLALSLKDVGLENVQFVTVPTEPYPLNPHRVQWTPAADQLWAAMRDDAPLPGSKAATTRAAADAAPSSADLTVSPADIRLRLVNDSGVSGLARTSADPLQIQGFKIESWVSGRAGSVNGVEVRYGPSQAEAAKTVAAAFPGAKLVASPALGSVIGVHLGAGASSVVEVPNRLGTEPLPRPSITAPAAPKAAVTFSTRTAAQDICH